MIRTAETAARKPAKLLASVLSAALLIPASGGLFPALAQVRTQTAPIAITPVAPVAPIGVQTLGTSLGSPVLPSGIAPTLEAIPTLVPSAVAGALGATARPLATARTLSASDGLATGLQLVPASQELAKLPSAAPAGAPAASTPRGAADAARANEERPSAIASAVQAASPERAAAAFDGVGILPDERPHHPELGLDPQPGAPRGGVAWDSVHVPSRRATGSGVVGRILGWVFGPGEAMILPGNPQDEAGVERGLRELIRSRPDLFSGLPPSAFRTRHVRKVAGQAGLADTFYANFQQAKDTLPVEGSYVHFVVKVMNGRTVVVGSTAELFPEASAVDTAGQLSDQELLRKATERLGTPTSASEDLRNTDRKVMYLGGQWRAVQTYFFEKLVVAVAVDVNTGQTFAWDPRMHLSQAAANASATGRGVADGPMKAGVELQAMALPHLQVEGPGGKFFTDAEGRFTVPGSGDQPVQLTFRLSGRYAIVQNQDREHDPALGEKDLVVTVSAKPGEQLRVVFNPQGQDAGAVAQVNAYVHTNRVHDWLVAHGVSLQALDKPMPVKVNIDDECNAYYTPWSPSLNFFKASARCSNSSYNDVNYHEYGHAVDDAAGGIQNGGLSEGWGDIIAIFMTGQPVVGRGFILEGSRDYIRHAENKYQYNPRDEVHKQGEAWMGFAWKLRQNLIASIGDPGRAAALAEHLVVPVFLASVKDIPSAIQQVLLRDIDANGNAPHLKEIQAAAAAHGIKVALPKAGQREGLFSTLATAVAQNVASASSGVIETFSILPRRGQAITPADLEALRKATGVRIVSLQPRVVVVEGDYADVRRVAEALGWTAARPAGHPVASGTRNL